MAATLTVQSTVGEVPSAPTFVERVKLVGDASYTTGGYALDLATVLPGKTIVGMVPTFQIGSDWGVVYDRANDKAIVFVISTGAEAASGANLATLDVELVFIAE